MAKHITVNESLHEMTVHAIQTVNWTNTVTIELYDATEFSGATMIMHINDGTNAERVILEIGNNTTDAGMDETRILIDGSLIDLTWGVSVSAGNVELEMNATGSHTTKYYLIPSDL